MTQLLLLHCLTDEAILRIKASGIRFVCRMPEVTWSDDELGRRLAGAEALVCLLTDRISGELMDSAPQLKIIANVAVGYDNIDVAAATERGIVVTNTPDVLTETTADLAMALLLAAARRIPEADAYMRAGRFKGLELFPDLVGNDVHGKTLGILGLGRIGQAVARRATLGFGMTVIYADERRKPAVETALGVQHVSFMELLASSDFLSLHTPLTRATRHLITLKELRQMKPTAYLINTARGPLVDEADLVKALQQGLIRGAGLDVFEHEPRMHPGLVELKERVVVAPHIGSATLETRQRMAMLAVENVLAWFAGEPLLSPVNPELLRTRHL